MTDEEELYAKVRTVIDNNTTTADISPAWIATQVMREINFTRALHRLGYAGCHLEVRQIARQMLRRRFDPKSLIDSSVAGEDDLFPETLQDRYPRRPRQGEEPVYALRNRLTGDDVTYNVDRMRRGGSALLRHADALEAWDADRPDEQAA